MEYLREKKEKTAMKFMEIASYIACQSTCLRKKVGSVIVKNMEIIGEGYNSPPGEFESQRRCTMDKENYDRKVTDKTCCIHAEQRAILRALINNPERIFGSSIYVAKINAKGERIFSDEPYCTICSKLALEVGISKFVLWHKEGIRVYNAEEYNNISFAYA